MFGKKYKYKKTGLDDEMLDSLLINVKKDKIRRNIANTLNLDFDTLNSYWGDTFNLKNHLFRKSKVYTSKLEPVLELTEFDKWKLLISSYAKWFGVPEKDNWKYLLEIYKIMSRDCPEFKKPCNYTFMLWLQSTTLDEIIKNQKKSKVV